MPANIISTIAQVFSSDLVARIASSLGLDRAVIDRALTAGAPALLAALGSLASKPGGAAAVNAEVARQEPQLFQNLGPLIGGAGMNSRIDAGSTALKSLLGSQAMSVLTSAISRYSGVGEVGTTNLMGLLSPIVMSVLADRQRSSDRSAADVILAEKDSIARALPAGVADALGRTGMLDWFTSSTGVQAGAREAAEPAFEFRPAKGRSGLEGWLLPALALLALGGLAWYLLSGPRTTEVAKTVPPPPAAQAPITTGALPEPKPADFASLQSLAGIKVGDVDIGAQVTEAVSNMRNALASIRGEASAQAAVDPLKQSAAGLEKVKGLTSQLSPELRATVAKAIAAARPTLDGLIEKALQIPGVATFIQPAVDSIRSELDTLATV